MEAARLVEISFPAPGREKATDCRNQLENRRRNDAIFMMLSDAG
jgi:hypothetical protein